MDETDDDNVVTLSESALIVPEGGEASYTVVLGGIPAENVTVTVTRTGDTDLRPTPSALTFTTGNWNTPRTVTVAASQDGDGAAGHATFVHRASGGFRFPNGNRVELTEGDDDSNVFFSAARVVVPEGAGALYTVRLGSAPAAPVTIEVTKGEGGDADLTVHTTELIFTTGGWNTPQAVNLAAAEDEDGIAGEATVIHTAISTDTNFNGITVSDVTLVEGDNDQGIVVSSDRLTVREDGEATWTVKLAAVPGDWVTVTVAPEAGADPDLVVDPATLTFSTNSWNTAQTVTVEAAQDDDEIKGEATFVHLASGGGYDGATGRVIVREEENPARVLPSVAQITIMEGGEANYTVTLAAEPAEAVTIRVRQDFHQDNPDPRLGENILTVTPEYLTFTTTAWSAAQTVTLAMGGDGDTENGVAIVLHRATSGDLRYNGLTIPRLRVDQTDTTKPGVTLRDEDGNKIPENGRLEVREGETESYTIELDTRPVNAQGNGMAVNILVSIDGDGDLSLDGSPWHHFSTAAWNGPRTVTVRAGQDTDGLRGEAVIKHYDNDRRYLVDAVDGLGPELTVREIDDDAGIVIGGDDHTEGKDPNVTVEEGSSATWTVELASEPAGDVTVSVARKQGDDEDLTVAPASLVFTTGDFSVAQTVTVRAAEDDDTDDGEARFTLTAEGGDYGGVDAAEVIVEEDDDDTASFTVSVERLDVPEGTSAHYTVVLDTQPTAAVTVTPAAAGDTDISVSGALTFTTTNWSTAQTVTVNAAVDADTASGTATITHTAASTDSDYGGIAIASVTVTEAETPTVFIDEAPDALENLDPFDVKIVFSHVVVGFAAEDIAVTHGAATLAVGGPVKTGSGETYTAEITPDGAGDVTITIPKWVARSVAGIANLASETVTVAYNAGPTFTGDGAFEVEENTSRVATIKAGDANADDSITGYALSGGVDQDLFLIDADTGVLAFRIAPDYENPKDSASETPPTAAGDNEYSVEVTARSGSGDRERTVARTVTVTVTDVVEPPSAVDPPTVVSAEATALTVEWLEPVNTGPPITQYDLEYRVVDADTWRDSGASGIGTRFTVGALQPMTRYEFRVRAVNAEGVGAWSILEEGKLAGRGATAEPPNEGPAFTSADSFTVAENTVEVGMVEAQDQDGADAVTGYALTGGPDQAAFEIDSDTGALAFREAPNFEDPTDLAGTDSAHTAKDNNYVVEVTATSGVDPRDLPATQTITVTVTDESNEVPGPPAAPALADATSGSLAVSWSVPDNAGPPVSGYHIRYRIAVTGSWREATHEGLETGLTLGDLLGGTRYEVQVRATNEDGTGLWSPSGSGTTLSPAITPSATSLEVAEGDETEFTVKLAVQPSGPVTVTLTMTGDGDIGATPAALTFTTASWSNKQAVTVTAAGDEDTVHGTAVFTLSGEGGGYDVVAVEVTAQEVDDDARIIVADPDAYSVNQGLPPNFGSGLVPVPAVEEGGAGKAYTVVLAAKPSGPVTVTGAEGDKNGEVTLVASPTVFTFTTDDWNTKQTVTISAAEDDDREGGLAAFVLTAASGDAYEGVTAQVGLFAVLDDDNGVIVHYPGIEKGNGITVPENGIATYTLVLSLEPKASVTISVAPKPDSDPNLTAAPAVLTFTTRNWDEPQTVTVTAADDDDPEAGTATLTHTATSRDGFYDEIAIAEVKATEDDNDVPGIVVTVPDPEPGKKLTVREDETSSWEVKLATEPSGNVTVAVELKEGGDPSFVLQDRPGLVRDRFVFTPDDWSTAQTVTVKAEGDVDAIDGEGVFEHSASSSEDKGYENLDGPTVPVIEDDDDAALVLKDEGDDNELSELSVEEGKRETYTAVLAALPGARVTVTVVRESGGDEDLVVTPRTLIFTTANWDRPRTLTVVAAADADGANGAATFTHTAVGGKYDGTASDVDDDMNPAKVQLQVTEIDDDPPFVFSDGDVQVQEGRSAPWTVRLSAQPSERVTVNVTRAQGGDEDLSVTPATLTFTTADWSVPQTLTVAAAPDDDLAAGEATFVHTASGGPDYDGLRGFVFVTEVDANAEVRVSESEITVPEGGEASWTVALVIEPSAPVTIAVAAADGGDASLTASPAELTFTTDDWNTARTVTVTAAEDDDAANGMTSFTLSVGAATGSKYDGVEVDPVKATEADDDADLILSTVRLEVKEGEDPPKDFTVRLAAAPGVPVTLAVTRADGGDASLTASPAELTFTTDDWNTARTVTVTAAPDDDVLDGTATFTLRASGGAHDGLSRQVEVLGQDDDREVVLTVDGVVADMLPVPEGGQGAFGVELGGRPTGTVTVTLTKTGDEDITASPAVLTFTTANWDTPQTVTAAARVDDDILAGTATFTLTASGGGYVGVTAQLTATEVDDDAALVLSATALTVKEEGFQTWTVALAAAPDASVTVSVMATPDSDPDPDLTFMPAELTFTTDNWRNGQLMTVTAAADEDAIHGEADLKHVASGGGVHEALTITVTEADDDAAVKLSVEADGNTLSVDEGTDATYTAVLAAAPAASVTVSVTANGDTELTVMPAALTFATGNWMVPQTVTVSVAEDSVAVERSATIVHTVSGGDYDGYDGVEIPDVTVTGNDNDKPGLNLSTNALSVPEDGTATWVVSLNKTTAPTADVTVTVTKKAGGDADLTVSPDSFTFTTADWLTKDVTVTVRAGDDLDIAQGTAVFEHRLTSVDSRYDGIDGGSVEVTETEDDEAVVTVSPDALTVFEDGSAHYTVVLGAPPSAPVTITVAKQGEVNSELDLSPPSLVFTTGNWSRERTVTVRARIDPNGEDGSATVVHSAASGDSQYNVVVIDPVTVTEDEKPTATITTMLDVVGIGQNFDVTVTFSEAVQGFEASDIAVTNGSVRSLAKATGSETAYTASIAPDGGGDSITIAIGKNVVTDGAGNGNQAARLDVTMDRVVPTVQVTGLPAVAGTTKPFDVDVDFSEPVTGFETGDVTVTNGTVTVAGSGAEYTATITPDGQGNLTIAIAANVATDAANNGNQAATPVTVPWDGTRPTVTITGAPAVVGSTDAFDVKVEFNEAVTGFETGDVTVTNGTATVAGSGAVYTATITPDGQGDITIAIAANVAEDTAGNGNQAATDVTVTYDATAPTVAITGAPAVVGSTDAFEVTVTFSETVTGFDASDLTVTNGSATVEGSDAKYTASITPDGRGDITIAIGANVATDAAGNGNEAAEDVTVPWDGTGPTVTITGAPEAVNSTDAFEVTVTFSEAVTGFEAGDITVTNGSATVKGGDAEYTASITPDGGSDITIAIGASVATDSVGNGNQTATPVTVAWDVTEPTVAISGAPVAVNSADAFDVTVTFNEAVTGFEAGDITVTNGGATTVTGSDAVYTASITPDGSGDIVIAIGANVATDAAGNGNEASASATVVFNLAPTFGSDATFEVEENETTVGDVVATDTDASDTVTGYAVTGGADRALFAITDAGALTFTRSPNFEDPTDAASSDPSNAAKNNEYVLVVTATSGAGDRELTAAQTITVTVTDVDGEAPAAPSAPTITGVTATGFTVGWIAPENTGPPITGYAVQYREGTSGTWADAGHSGTGLSVAVTGLTVDTGYEVQVQATNAEGTGAWSASSTVTTTTVPNAAPTFTSAATFSVAENAPTVGTVAATDADASDSVDGYGITGGADRAKFSIHAVTGALTFDTAPNYEDPSDADNDNDYVVEVTATSGTSPRELTATQAITVTVTDVAEAPSAPSEPTISDVTASGFTVTWTAPENAGPEITDYAVQYRVSGATIWTAASHSRTGLTLTLTGLAAGTGYEVQVQATNAEGTSPWSATATATTEANAAPTFTSAATFSVAENATEVGTVAATDADASDSITGYAVTGGADQALFSVVAGTGVLTFNAAPNFEAPSDADTDNDYVVEVTAAGGADARELTATQMITVTVTNEVEVPSAPAAPTISSVTATGFTVTWTAPANTGPAITDYDVQYRVSGATAWTDAGHNGTTLTVTLTGLTAATDYEVQVQATNAEGTGAWSASATATTAAEPGVTVSESALTVREGGNATYTVVLDTEPAAAVTVTPAAAGDSDISVSGALTFTTTNWSTAQTVTVSAEVDADTASGTATVTHTAVSTDSDYGGITIASVTVTEGEAPTVAITGAPAAVGSTDTFNVTVTFSEAVTGFDATDITVTNGSVTVTGSGTEYTATITPDGQGDITIAIDANVATDIAGNGNQAATDVTVTWDATSPTVGITGAPTVVNSTDAFGVTVTFSEAVTGFETGDVTVTNGSATVSGSGTTYTASITPDGQGDITIGIGANVAEDAAGNGNDAATDVTVPWDADAPTVAITGTPAAVGSTAAFDVTVTFSEAVTGFETGDVTVTNGTATVSGSGTTYTASITPDGNGDITIAIGADVAEDAAGNGNDAATDVTVPWDADAPTVAITGAPPAVNSTDAFDVTVTFSEAVTGFETGDVTVTNGTATVSGSEADYTATITPDGQGDITIGIGANVAEDTAGNGNDAATDVTVPYDATAPTVAITGAPTVVGSTNAFDVTVTFSEAVTGFDADDITVTNGTATVSGSGADYTATITPDGQGDITIGIGANVAEDAAGNGNDAATDVTVPYDADAPTVTITGAPAAVGSTAAFDVTVTFSEAVTGFETGDVTVTNGTATVSGSGADYTATITPDGNGDVTIAIGADVAEDAAGNGNDAATDVTVPWDADAPTVAITGAPPAVNSTDAFDVTVTFSEAVTDLRPATSR